MQRANTKAIQKMDAKKTQTDSATKKFQGKKVVEFVGEVKQELRKVDWTSKDELKSYTKIVLISTFFIGMIVYLIDLLIQGALGGINLIVKLITG